MAITTSNTLIGKAETDFAQAAGVDRLGADKDTFLKLLVAQLSNQDPLNPTEDKEFITQLAQFTSLEQLQGINAGVTTLNSSMQESQMTGAVSFIGKEVLAGGDEISKIGDYASTVYFTFDEAIAGGEVNILDTHGVLVQTVKLDASNAGEYQYEWNGRNGNGQVMPDGVYTVRISARDANDKPVLSTTQVAGRVIGVQNDKGVYSLRLADLRLVKFTDVAEVLNAVASSDTGAAAAE